MVVTIMGKTDSTQKKSNLNLLLIALGLDSGKQIN